MRACLGVLIACLAVAGCTKTVAEMNYTERKALAEVIVKRCYEQGVRTGTPEMDACMRVETESEIATRNRQAAVQDARRSSGPTVCNKVGNTVICN